MVGWRERHYEDVQDEYSTAVAAVDPEVAWIRRRLANMGLLKFMSVHYVCTLTKFISLLVSLWREVP